MFVCVWVYVSAGACAEVAGFGRVMDCLFCATHFLINPQPHPGGGGSKRDRERERDETNESCLTKEDKGRRE